MVVPLKGAKKATNRVTAANLSRMAKRLGRCGDIDPITGYVCVTQPHDDETQHAACQIGGPMDGHIYHQWGGTGFSPIVMPPGVTRPAVG